jgi:hypothetical protein
MNTINTFIKTNFLQNKKFVKIFFKYIQRLNRS